MNSLDEFQQQIRELLEDHAAGNSASRLRIFLNGPCPLLRAARDCLRRGSLDELRGWLAGSSDWHAFRDLWKVAPCETSSRWTNPVEARECLLGVADRDPESYLPRALELYEGLWGWEALHGVAGPPLPAGWDPAFLERIQDSGVQAALRDLAHSGRFGPWHPGLHLAVATWAWLYEDPGEEVGPLPAESQQGRSPAKSQSAGDGAVPTSDGLTSATAHTFDPDVKTWVLLAAADGRGYAARLELQKVPGGCGAFYPDPLFGGYLTSNRAFQRGLQQAWWVAVGRDLRPGEITFDVRWRLRLIDANDVPLFQPVTGRSAEVAFACALRALRDNVRLDENVAVTAKFQPGSPDFELAPVGRVADKLLAREMGPDVYRRRIIEVLVHPEQESGGEKVTGAELDNGNVRIRGVHTFDLTYEGLTYWSRLTRQLNEQLAERARAERNQACGKYELSTVSPRRQRGPAAAASAQQAGSEWGKPLDKPAIRRLQHGRWAHRVQLVGSSGIGKTTFLLDCEYQIAHGNDGDLPVRVKLADFQREDAGCEAMLRGIADSLVDIFPVEGPLPDRSRMLVDLLDRLRRAGRLVFLLDALDQAAEPKALDRWLSTTGGVAACPVVMTGRPLAERAVGDADWKVLQVNPFDDEQIKRYLGDKWYRKLVRQNDDSDSVRRRKHQWESLLRTPFTLKMLRDLAETEQLDGLVNRFHIYRRTAEDLIAHGIQSAEDAGLEVGLDGELEQTLGRIAWWMLSSRNFRGVLDGAEFRRLVKELAIDADLKLLHQVNLVRVLAGKDRRRPAGLEWRHLSFCEYFAGVHVATALTAEEQAPDLSNCLPLPLPEHRQFYDRETKEVPGFVNPERWEPTLTFALLCLQDGVNGPALNRLAADVIRYGSLRSVNAFLQSDAGQGRPRLDPELETYCRFLSSRSLHWRRDLAPLIVDGSTEEWTKLIQERVGAAAPDAGDVKLTADLLQLVEDQFSSRHHRSSECLAAAWDLLEARSTSDPEAAACLSRIRERFLAERGELAGSLPALETYLKSFRPCPKEPGAPRTYQMGEDGDDRAPVREVTVEPFELADFPVTNSVFEAFDPSHVWDRDQWSSADDQPAVWVNWYQARLFAVWLGGLGTTRYRLPLEQEWEYACRAGTTQKFWWGKEPDPERFNGEFEGKRRLNRTNSRHDSELDVERHKNAWDLYDMLGNVWEWCEDELTEPPEIVEAARRFWGLASFRVLRGGAFYVTPEFCRSASRSDDAPVYRNGHAGFRLVRFVVESPQLSSS